MNAKENLLRAIRHDHPQWVPNGSEAVATIDAMHDEIAIYGQQLYSKPTA